MKYQVTGNHLVAGKRRGQFVHLDDETQARQLVKGGHVRAVPPPKPADDKADDKAGESDEEGTE